MSRQSKWKSDNARGTYGVLLIFGICVFSIAFIVLSNYCKQSTTDNARETLIFVEDCIGRVKEYMLSDKTKSLVRLLDKTKGLSQCLGVGEAYQESDLDEAKLDEYIYNQRMTGIIVLDEDLNLVIQSSTDGDAYAYWRDEIESEDIKSIANHSKRSYLTRVDKDDCVYDFVAVGCDETEGVVIGYVRRDEKPGETESVYMEDLMDDFTFKQDAIIVISDGNTIISSNLESIKGNTISESFDGKDGTESLSPILVDGNLWYYMKNNAYNYQVYVCFSVGKVMQVGMAILGFAIILYAMLWMLFVLLRHRTVMGNLLQIKKQYAIIDAINSIYSANFLIHLDTGVMETIKAPDKLVEKLKNVTNASDVLDWIVGNLVADSYCSEYREFMNVDTMAQRLENKKCISFSYEDIYGEWYLSILIPQQRGENDKITGVLAITRNISEDKRRESVVLDSLQHALGEAQRANMAKNNFLRRMSHDVRTPINGVCGMVEISRRYIGDEAKQEECRRKILNAAGFLLDLVNSVLDMSKLESGEIKLESKPFHLIQLLGDIRTVAEITGENAQVTYTDQHESILHTNLIGSPVHLRQILQNISSNAIKYNRKGGFVHLTAREISADADTAMFEFVCEDNGIGMSEEFQIRAFEPFAQEHDAARTAYHGVGLGLAITKELVEQMGGTITFTSHENEGTTFTIRIPFQINHAVQDVSEQAEAFQDISIEGVRVLLVEDNELNMEIAEFLLEDEGAMVTQAYNGQEALDLFANNAPGTFDIILMDVMMPVMDGREATRRIRSLERDDAVEIPIVAVTANAFLDDVEESFAVGMNGHLTKPLDADKLKKEIYRLVIV